MRLLRETGELKPMRSLNSAQAQATERTRTNPNYFITIELDDHYQWTSSTPAVNADPGPVLVGSVSGERATLFVYNDDDRFTQDVIQGAYLGNFAAIAWAYEDADPILIFTGMITSIPDVDDNGWMRVECERSGPRVYPKGRFLPPQFNHLPPPGYSLEFDGALITIGD